MQDRHVYLLHSPTSEKQQQLIQAVDNIEHCLWISQSEPPELTANIHCLPHNKVQTILGSEFNLIVYDVQDGFYPNAFGMVVGTLRSGGVLMLLLPDSSQLTGRFNQRFLGIIQQSHCQSITPDQDLPKLTHLLKNPSNNNNFEIVLTTDQKDAVNAINKVVKGHRRRPLVITADRGRGKSTALGIAAKQLLSESLNKIILTAPSKKSAAIALKHANHTEKLVFIAPDELVQSKPETDLLLIDEAAAIPSPILETLLKHYSRIVFATTQHGYEGTGRGFEIRFKRTLNQLTPDWKALHLHTPIRWNDGDSLEALSNKILLLNADQAKFADAIDPNQCEITLINRDTLITDETLLSQIFGLLATAHYQTKPADLQYLLDDPSVSVYTVQFNDKVVATALTSQEGGFGTELSQAIYSGQRRPKGHLVAQSLCFHSGIDYAASLFGERIIRIAVHSDVQRQGIASRLVSYIIKHQKQQDYLAVSYGASSDTLQFWQKQAFKTVRIGLKRDACSGTHSVVQLLSISEQGQNLLKESRQRFQHSLPHLLAEPLAQLESDIIEMISAESLSMPFKLEKWQYQELQAFANTHRGYDISVASLWLWMVSFLATPEFQQLSKQDRALLIKKILQKQSWQNIVKYFGFSGKKQALSQLKNAIKQGLGDSAI